jgi:hypothetical protein
MLSRFVILLSLVVGSGTALAGPKEDALVAYDKFFALFIPDNHDEIVKLFAPDALFYGTGSPEVVTSHEGVRKYFINALSRKRGEVKATPFDRTALVLSDTVVAISGKWQSERMLDGKMATNGPARNTVVLQKRGDQWLIVQFHNSPTPKPTPKPAAAPAN